MFNLNITMALARVFSVAPGPGPVVEHVGASFTISPSCVVFTSTLQHVIGSNVAFWGVTVASAPENQRHVQLVSWW